MALTNAEKQRRFRDRNVIVLTDRAEEIAEKLIDMEDQAKLRKVARLVGNHLKNPNRSLDERNIDLGRVQIQGANGRPLGKRKALAELPHIRAAYQEEMREIEQVEQAYMGGEIAEEEFEAYWDLPVGRELPEGLKAKLRNFDEGPLSVNEPES